MKYNSIVAFFSGKSSLVEASCGGTLGKLVLSFYDARNDQRYTVIKIDRQTINKRHITQINSLTFDITNDR